MAGVTLGISATKSSVGVAWRGDKCREIAPELESTIEVVGDKGEVIPMGDAVGKLEVAIVCGVGQELILRIRVS